MIGIELDRDAISKLRQVELDGFWTVPEIGNAQQRVAFVFAKICENFAVLWRKQRQRAAPEGGMAAADSEHAPCPVENRMWIAALRLDIDHAIP